MTMAWPAAAAAGWGWLFALGALAIGPGLVGALGAVANELTGPEHGEGCRPVPVATLKTLGDHDLDLTPVLLRGFKSAKKPKRWSLKSLSARFGEKHVSASRSVLCRSQGPLLNRSRAPSRCDRSPVHAPPSYLLLPSPSPEPQSCSIALLYMPRPRAPSPPPHLMPPPLYPQTVSSQRCVRRIPAGIGTIRWGTSKKRGINAGMLYKCTPSASKTLLPPAQPDLPSLPSLFPNRYSRFRSLPPPAPFSWTTHFQVKGGDALDPITFAEFAAEIAKQEADDANRFDSYACFDSQLHQKFKSLTEEVGPSIHPGRVQPRVQIDREKQRERERARVPCHRSHLTPKQFFAVLSSRVLTCM